PAGEPGEAADRPNGDEATVAAHDHEGAIGGDPGLAAAVDRERLDVAAMERGVDAARTVDDRSELDAGARAERREHEADVAEDAAGVVGPGPGERLPAIVAADRRAGVVAGDQLIAVGPEVDLDRARGRGLDSLPGAFSRPPQAVPRRHPDAVVGDREVDEFVVVVAAGEVAAPPLLTP